MNKQIKPIVSETKKTILSIADETIGIAGNMSQNLSTGTPILDLASNVIEGAFDVATDIVSKVKGGIVGGIKGFFKGFKEG